MPINISQAYQEKQLNFLLLLYRYKKHNRHILSMQPHTERPSFASSSLILTRS